MSAELLSRKHDRMGLWMILLVVVITATLFFWTSSQHKQESSSTYKTSINAQGQLKVLGITLGNTSLKEAELALQSKSDVALYIYPEEDSKAGMKLEAFFPAIADHTKVVLLLSASPDELKGIESRATIPHLYPDKVARMNLAADDVTRLRTATVQELTLIPNLTLTPELLAARFGEPDHINQLPGKGNEYIYWAIGLKAVLADGEPPMLHFANPH